jgi:hypothetical protein
MSTSADKPMQPIKVLIPFGATREQIEKAVEQLLGPHPTKSKRVASPIEEPNT